MCSVDGEAPRASGATGTGYWYILLIEEPQEPQVPQAPAIGCTALLSEEPQVPFVELVALHCD
jgi:hypothetical protein